MNAVDYSGYPDCRPEFIRAFEALSNLATRAGVEARGSGCTRRSRGCGRRRLSRPACGSARGPGAHPQLLPTRTRQAGPAGRCDSCLIRREGFRGGRGAGPDAVRAVSWPLLVALAGLALRRDAGAPAGGLVEASARVPGLVVELRYATEENFLGKAVYPEGARCLLLAGVAERLAHAARTLEAHGYRLKAWDCYRPIDVQWAMWKLVPRRGYVADPHTGSNHNRGAAVDVTLATAGGEPVEMPTPFDTFGPAAHHGSSAGAAARANRETLRQAMVQAGFRANRMEWWHYDAPKGRAPRCSTCRSGPPTRTHLRTRGG